jgi:hypothetical protein
MLSALDELCVIELLAPPANCRALPPRKKAPPPELKAILLITIGLAMLLLSGVPAVPTFVVPAKTKSVALLLVGAPGVQFPAVLQFTLPPRPVHVGSPPVAGFDVAMAAALPFTAPGAVEAVVPPLLPFVPPE